MNFLNPFFLFGLLAVAIPVVIHLVNLRRPRKVSFSTLSFFNELRKSTIRRIRIKQYLLMALRALALLFLALALARPFLPPSLAGSTGSNEPKAIAIIMDNSASMNRVGSRGPLIDQAKEVAGRIIQNANSDDKFYITSTNEGRLAQKGLMTAPGALDRVSELSVQNTGHYTREKFRSAVEQLSDAPRSQTVIYVISDGQESQLSDLKGLAEKMEAKSTKSVSVQLISLEQGDQQNLTISSIELKNQMVSRGSPVTLGVKVENTADAEAVNKFVSLEVEGELSGQYDLSLKSGQTKEFLFQLVPEKVGDLSGHIILEGDEVEYDNERYFVLRIPKSRKILLVNKGGSSTFASYLSPALEAARKTNAQLSFEEKTPSEVDPSQWSNYDAVVLNGIEEVPEYWHQDLQRYVQKGNGLMFFPSEQGDIRNYNRFLSLFNAGEFTNVVGEYGSFQSVTKMADLEGGHPVLDEVFAKEEDEEIDVELSSLFYYFRYENSSGSGSLDILRAANGDPLLSEQKFGEGVVLVSTLGTDPGWSNLPVNPLFAPLYYRSTLYASSSERAGLQQHILGHSFSWEGKALSSEVKLAINASEYKPEVKRQANGIRIEYGGREWKPGILSVIIGDQHRKVAVNQSIMESRFNTLSNKKWQQMLGDEFNVNDIIDAESLSSDGLQEKLSATMFGKEIWNWLIWIALLFLIAETAVARLYKAESIS